MQCRHRPMAGDYCLLLSPRCLFARCMSVNSLWPGNTIWHPMTHACQGRPGYLREPEWNSIGFPETSRATPAGMITVVIFCPGNGLSPPQYQAITETNSIIFALEQNSEYEAKKCNNFHLSIMSEIFDQGVCLFEIIAHRGGHVVHASMS